MSNHDQHPLPQPPGFGAPAPEPVGAAETSTTKKNWFRRHKVLTGVLGGVILVGAIGALTGEDPAPESATHTSAEPAHASAEEGAGSSASSQGSTADESAAESEQQATAQQEADQKTAAEKKDAEKKSAEKKAAEKKAEPPMSSGQRNALRAAENYLDLMPFSRKGLIKQLSSEYGDGYSVDDATFAADHVTVDWNEQAAKAAKNYLDMMPFSREGLIEQLTSDYGDGYTRKQATYGVDQAGL